MRLGIDPILDQIVRHPFAVGWIVQYGNQQPGRIVRHAFQAIVFHHVGQLLGIEHRADESLPGEGDTRRYGGTVLTFYRTKRVEG